MPTSKPSRKKSIYDFPRYWYHLSSTLTKRRVHLTPWDNTQGINRTYMEPNVRRTCVAPSVAHCLTAIPYAPGDKYIIYRTSSRVNATKPHGVFDSNITQEGWIQEPCLFSRFGTITLKHVAKGKNLPVVEEAASGGEARQSGKVLKWWKNARLNRYIKRS